MNNLSNREKVLLYWDNTVLGTVSVGFTGLGTCASYAEASPNRLYSALGYIGNRTCTILACSTLGIAIIVQVAKTAFLHFLAFMCRCCNNSLKNYSTLATKTTGELVIAFITLKNHSSGSYKFYSGILDGPNKENTSRNIMRDVVDFYKELHKQTKESLYKSNPRLSRTFLFKELPVVEQAN